MFFFIPQNHSDSSEWTVQVQNNLTHSPDTGGLIELAN